MRNPAIHITYTDLVKCLKKVAVKDPEHVASRLLEVAVPYNLKGRYIVKTTTKAATKKVERMIASSTSGSLTVEQFNQLLYARRVQAGHRNIKPIRKDDPSYQMLKEVAGLAYHFCKDNGVEDLYYGAQVYLDLGIYLMKKQANYALNKYKYHNERIGTLYTAMRDVEDDPDKESTQEFVDLYLGMLQEYAGVERSLDVIEWAYMVYGRQEADAEKAEYDYWIRAQFEALSFLNSVANPQQVYGDEAKKRYYSYIGRQQHKNAKTYKETAYEDKMAAFDEAYKEKLKKAGKL